MDTCFKFLNCQWGEIFNPSVSRRCQRLMDGDGEKQDAARAESSCRVDNENRKRNAFLRKLANAKSAVREFEDDFIMGQEIGSGSFATVYKAHPKEPAHDAGNELAARDRAVKVISLTGAERDMIANELHTLLLLDHPHVLALHSWYETSADMMLVTELCFGTLADIKTPQSLEVARPIFRSIFSAVAYAHAHDFLHRDLKPGNVLFTQNGTVKVADWGLSIRVINGQAPKTTQGTLYYLAPEALIKPYISSFEADVWSTGVMLYMFLHDYHPFLSGNTGKPRVSYRQLITSPSLIPHPFRSMDDDMSSLITECLMVDTTKRPTALACWKSPALEDHLIDISPSGRVSVRSEPRDDHDVEDEHDHASSGAATPRESAHSSDSESTMPSVNHEGESPRLSGYGMKRAFVSGVMVARNSERGKPARRRSDDSNHFALTPKKRGIPTIVESLQNYCRALDKSPASGTGSDAEAKAFQDATMNELLHYDTEAYFEYYMQAVNERGVLELTVDGKQYVLAYSEFVHAIMDGTVEETGDTDGGVRERSLAAPYFPTLEEVNDLRRTLNLRATTVEYAPELREKVESLRRTLNLRATKALNLRATTVSYADKLKGQPTREFDFEDEGDVNEATARRLKTKVTFDFPTVTTDDDSGRNNAHSVSDPDSPVPTVVTPS